MMFVYEGLPWALLRSVNDFGFDSYDLVGLPRRLSEGIAGNLVAVSIDRRRTLPVDSPASQALHRRLADQDNWLAVSQRTLARVSSAFLVAEDPQRRIEARKAATLMHQVSLVQHILSRDDLRKVLIGDEVGLGKTIEAGLLVRQLIDQNPSMRVLYLAPARLVANVAREFQDKLDIDARRWVAGNLSDARIQDDKVVIASINRAVFGDNFERVVASGPWDVVIVDECHHLSDWNPSGGKPNQAFRLVTQLMKNQPPDGRLILLSGTPHQGNEARFRNILKLLSDDGKNLQGAAGRVIFRTKDRVRDWNGAPLFPSREIRKPVVVQLGEQYIAWYQGVGALYDGTGANGTRLRAAGWAKGQALQWAASSVQAGVGFLVRLGMRRLGWTLANEALRDALSSLRPYRGGARDEPLSALFDRVQRQIRSHLVDQIGEEDDEDIDVDEWRPDAELLAHLLRQGVSLIRSDASATKWDAVCELIDRAEGEKVVLFAQPVETVTLVADILERRYGSRPALIIGNQSDEERTAEVARFQRDDGPRFLVSSKAGGEGLNMQKARRLIHLDVPWNPMDLEQRIGRVHRFGSRKTVIVDTVVAAGSREVDMYRIAREKLLMVAKHLDPEQFETLFSRVMSLVPPQELEGILGNVAGSQFIDNEAANEIGRLVTAGFKSWSQFDSEYRRQADEIRAANPGEARWADLGAFMVRFGGGKDGAGATFSSFTFADDEIISVDEQLPSIVLDDQVYVCGDTGGLPAMTDAGTPARSLGLNVDVAQAALRSAFANVKSAGVAFLNAPPGLDVSLPSKQPLPILVLLRQRLQHDGGLWHERALSLHTYALEGTPRSLTPQQGSAVIRAMLKASRIKDPMEIALPANLQEVEQQLIDELRRPEEDELALGVRYAVWPLAVVIFQN